MADTIKMTEMEEVTDVDINNCYVPIITDTLENKKNITR